MKKVVFLLLFINLYASNLIDTYRFEGITPIKNMLEQKIQSKDYWLNDLKNKNITYGYYENNTFILLCNKTLKTLKVYKYSSGKARELFEFEHLITGKLGQKQAEGDLITPIGVYSFTKKIIPKNKFYGPLAFVTSYPNLYDKIKKRDGHGIWIHGKPLDGQRSDLSKGCIVLNNNDLIKLADNIDYNNTVLQIYQQPIFATKDDIASILALIYKWRYAWEKSDLKKYISFYDKDFKRSNGNNLKQFTEYKKRVFDIRKHQKINIYFKNITIVPYQNFENITMYRVSFNEEYYAPNFTFKGQKEIFVRKRGDDFKIFIEK